MRDPKELVSRHHRVQFPDRPILLYAFTGFVDAGSGVRVASDHILSECEHRLVATFDSDELLDYRARRPRMTYVVDHFAAVEMPEIALHEVTDLTGQRFLMLSGPEPDYQWMRFLGAVDTIIDTFDVRLAVGLSAIPWPIPHTRPLGITLHGSEPDLVAGHVSVIGEIEVPGHVGAMLELHLGQRGVPSMGVTAQVPHYLVQFEFPRAAITLLKGVSAATGLVLPSEGLDADAKRADDEVAEQLEGNDEFAGVVAALEAQYDQMAAISSGAAGGLADLAGANMPTGDEIAAQVEQFLSSLDDNEDEGKQD
jgi:hypothetical protein